MLQVGTVVDVHGRPYTITTTVDGSQESCPLESPVCRQMTLESMWFPFFFMRATGFYAKGVGKLRSMTDYLRHRMHQLFSVFTLNKMYISHMWQVRQCGVIANAVGGVAAGAAAVAVPCTCGCCAACRVPLLPAG